MTKIQNLHITMKQRTRRSLDLALYVLHNKASFSKHLVAFVNLINSMNLHHHLSSSLTVILSSAPKTIATTKWRRLAKYEPHEFLELLLPFFYSPFYNTNGLSSWTSVINYLSSNPDPVRKCTQFLHISNKLGIRNFKPKNYTFRYGVQNDTYYYYEILDIYLAYPEFFFQHSWETCSMKVVVIMRVIT